jgi:hypothetical protein
VAFPGIALGILILFNTSKKIKKVRGSYLKLETDNFSYKSQEIESIKGQVREILKNHRIQHTTLETLLV